MTSKEKKLANTDIEISQHVLLTFKFFCCFFVSSILVGRGKLQKERHSFMVSLFAVKNLMTTKSRECRSAFLI